jgi:hypothetical protein
MNSTMTLAGGLTAACAVCCAVSVVPALLAGTSLAVIGGAASTWGIGLAALAVPVAALYVLSRRKALPNRPNANLQTLMASESCGCGPSCGSAKKADVPIACTLDVGDFKERTAYIRDLARRALRNASRTRLTLALTYELDALEEVRELVRKEQTCCAFLDFDLKSNSSSVLLTVTAPQSAADAVDILFDHFAPELAAGHEVDRQTGESDPAVIEARLRKAV